MTTAKMPDDLFTAIVKGDITRAEHVDAVGKTAERVDAVKILHTSTGSGHAARRISMAAIAVRESHRAQLAGAVRERVQQQAGALKQADPTQVKAITDADIAEHKAAQIKGAQS